MATARTSNRRNRDHSAMATFAAQPSQEHPHQHSGVEPIRLGPLVLARDRDAARTDDVGDPAREGWVDPVPGQPPCQPEAVSSGFERNADACGGETFPDALVTPAMQHTQQFRFVRCDLLQWLAFDPWNAPGDQPTRLTELNHGNQGGGVLEGGELTANRL
jgi:hypothetical protein